MKKIVIFILLAVFLGFQGLYAGLSFEAGVVSSYVWRGMDLYPKNKAALQPSLTYTFGKSGLSVNLWGSFILKDRAIYNELEEIDLTVNYDFQVSENVSLSAGFINYSYLWSPGYKFKDSNSQEIYVALGFPKVFLSPTFAVYYDFGLGKGVYANLSVGHSFKVSDQHTLSVGASLGYNGKQWIEESGISDLNLSASIPFTFGKVTLTPSVNLTQVFLEELYRVDDKKSKFWIGVVIGIE